MLWHAPSENLCARAGTRARVADTGINRSGGYTGSVTRIMIPVEHLGAEPCLQMTAAGCLLGFLLPCAVSQNKKDLWKAAELQLDKGPAEAARLHFSEGRNNSENGLVFSSSSVVSLAGAALACLVELISPCVPSSSGCHQCDMLLRNPLSVIGWLILALSCGWGRDMPARMERWVKLCGWFWSLFWWRWKLSQGNWMYSCQEEMEIFTHGELSG